MRAARSETLSELPTNHSSADGNLSFLVVFLILVFSVNIFVVVTRPSAHSNTPNASQHHILCSAGKASISRQCTRRRGGAGGFFYFPKCGLVNVRVRGGAVMKEHHNTHRVRKG